MAKVGRKPHKPTDENRKMIEKMSAVGIDQESIAKVMGMSVETLFKYYKPELEMASTKANTSVAGALYRNAIGGNVAAQIFWCKTRMGWREKSEVEHTGKDGAPLLAVIREYNPKEK